MFSMQLLSAAEALGCQIELIGWVGGGGGYGWGWVIISNAFFRQAISQEV